MFDSKEFRRFKRKVSDVEMYDAFVIFPQSLNVFF